MAGHDQSNAGKRLRSRESEGRNVSGTDETMSTCAGCGESLSDDRPAHRVVLEIADRTRSTKGFMGDETNLTRYCLGRHLCGQCWNGWYDRLAAN